MTWVSSVAYGRQRRPMIATSSPRPVDYSPSTQQWLDFLAGLPAQTAWAERTTADRPDLRSRP